MKKILSILWLFSCISLSAQESNKDFLYVAGEIDRLLQYDDVYPTQLKSLLAELETLSEGNELLFNQIKLRVDHLMLPIEIKAINTAIKNDELIVAYKAISVIKKEYDYHKDIQKLDNRLNASLYDRYKEILIDDLQPRLTLEPTYSWYSSDYTFEELSDFENYDFAPEYGVGISYNFGIKSIYSSGNKYYTYSQIGLRTSIRSNSTIYIPNGRDVSVVPERNTEITLLYRKTVGLAVGAYTMNDPTDFTLYNATTSFYIPIKGLSLGVHARIITDFDMDPILQFGASAKLNLKFYKPFTKKHKDEIDIRIIKFKESNRL